MIALIVTLMIIGVLLYLIEQLPMDPVIRTVIRLIVLLCVILYLLSVFGIFDVPVPRVRR